MPEHGPFEGFTVGLLRSMFRDLFSAAIFDVAVPFSCDFENRTFIQGFGSLHGPCSSLWLQNPEDGEHPGDSNLRITNP